MDIATLGIKLDSSDLKAGKTALDQFAAAAKPAADAAHGVEAAHAGMSTQAMAAQHSIRSMVEGLAQGIPISQMMGMQINHLAYAASGEGGLTGAFKQAGAAILGLVSPTALAVGGLAAVAAGGVLAYNSILATEKAFDDTSLAAGVTIGQLHDLASAASFKGIDPSEFLKAMDRFASDVGQAKNGMGQIAAVFRANGQSAQSFNQYLERAADLIANAGSNQQKLQLLQEMGLPATENWVRLLSSGADGLRQAQAEATKFGGAADEQMIAKAREFEEAWARATNSLENGFKTAFVGVLNGFSSFSSAVQGLYLKLGANPLGLLAGGNGSQLSQATANDFYSKVGTAAPFNAPTKTTQNRAVLQHTIGLQQQAVGLFGQMPAAQKPAKEKDSDSDHLRLPKAA